MKLDKLISSPRVVRLEKWMKPFRVREGKKT